MLVDFAGLCIVLFIGISPYAAIKMPDTREKFTARQVAVDDHRHNVRHLVRRPDRTGFPRHFSLQESG